MLDVHPPHAPAHTWRDFFTHIATIVVGLLIAIGLEQTVEYFHHGHQMREAREHIREEVLVNQRVLREDRQHTAELMDHLNHDLDLVNAVGTPHQDLSATLDFTWVLQNFFDAAYSGAKDSGALSRLPYDESATYEDAYTGVAMSTDAMLDCIKQLYAAKAILQNRRLTDLPPDQLAALRSAITSAVAKAEYYRLVNDLEGQEWEAILSHHYRNDISGAGK